MGGGQHAGDRDRDDVGEPGSRQRAVRLLEATRRRGGRRREHRRLRATGPELVCRELLAIDELLLTEADAERHDLDAPTLHEIIGKITRAVRDDADACAGRGGSWVPRNWVWGVGHGPRTYPGSRGWTCLRLQYRLGVRTGFEHRASRLHHRFGGVRGDRDTDVIERRLRAASILPAPATPPDVAVPPRREHERGAAGDHLAQPGEPGHAGLEDHRIGERLAVWRQHVDLDRERPVGPGSDRYIDEHRLAWRNRNEGVGFGEGQLRGPDVDEHVERLVVGVLEAQSKPARRAREPERLGVGRDDRAEHPLDLGVRGVKPLERRRVVDRGRHDTTEVGVPLAGTRRVRQHALRVRGVDAGLGDPGEALGEVGAGRRRQLDRRRRPADERAVDDSGQP